MVMMTPKAFNAAFGPLRPLLLDEARRLSGDDTLSEDLVQETLLRLWLVRQRLTGHTNTEALARTTLRHLWIDHWRREKKRESIWTELNAEAAALTTEDDEDAELMRLLIKQLPPLQQQIFRLSEIEGYEREEIMAITGCTAESLRQNLSRARRRLRRQYLRLAVIGLAMVAIVVLLVGRVTTAHTIGEPDFAIIDGQRTTDAAVVRQEAEEALRIVSSTEEDDFEALDMFSL